MPPLVAQIIIMTSNKNTNSSPIQYGWTKLRPGENKIRVLAKPVVGVSSFNVETKQTKRFRTFLEVDAAKYKNVKPFMACKVYNYDTGLIELFSFNQKNILYPLAKLNAINGNYDIRDVDIVISRDGEGVESKYTVSNLNPSEVPLKAVTLAQRVQIDFEAFFENTNPFTLLEHE